MSYDPKCWDLALSFLDEGMGVEDGEVAALAQEIQDAVEAWLNGNETAKRNPPRASTGR